MDSVGFILPSSGDRLLHRYGRSSANRGANQKAPSLSGRQWPVSKGAAASPEAGGMTEKAKNVPTHQAKRRGFPQEARLLAVEGHILLLALRKQTQYFFQHGPRVPAEILQGVAVDDFLGEGNIDIVVLHVYQSLLKLILRVKTKMEQIG